MHVSVHELKNHLSQYLQKIKTGEELVVTCHKEPLAVINAIPSAKKNALNKFSQLSNVEWNGKKPKGLKNGPKIHGKTVAERVLEDRR